MSHLTWSMRRRLLSHLRKDDHHFQEVSGWVPGRIDGLSDLKIQVGQSRLLQFVSRGILRHHRGFGSRLLRPLLLVRLPSRNCQEPTLILARDLAVILSSIKRRKGSWSQSPIQATGIGSRSQLPISKEKVERRRMTKSRRGDVNWWNTADWESEVVAGDDVVNHDIQLS